MKGVSDEQLLRGRSFSEEILESIYTPENFYYMVEYQKLSVDFIKKHIDDFIKIDERALISYIVNNKPDEQFVKNVIFVECLCKNDLRNELKYEIYYDKQYFTNILK